MAQAFNLTAEINLRGPSNIRTVVADIRRQLGSIDVNINPRLDQNAARNIAALNNSLSRLNSTLAATRTSAIDASRAINDLVQAANGLGNRSIQQNISNTATACQNLGRSAGGAGGNIGGAATQMEEFGRQSSLAVRRFAAFSIVTRTIQALTSAISSGVAEFIAFDKEFVRLQQVTNESANSLRGLSAEITRLSVGLGISSSELTTVAVTLAQAGLSASDTKRALEALAKSSLAPSFDDINQTVEGSIALMRQFGIGAADLEKALGSINSVSAKFAVEASDIIAAIQRTGGVFATASKGVSEGTDALNEFISVFTSVRQTTRESAETIATGLRTVFTRIQRGQTIDALKEFGIELTDLEGKFVGPYEAIRRLSQGLSQLDPRDIRFSQIVEELGGFRQIGKVIPLIQQFAVAQQALKVAQTGQGSLAEDAATAQLSLANQIAKVQEEFKALIRSIGESESFRSFVGLALQLASALIKVADAAQGVLPALTAIATIRGASALYQFGTGFSRGLGGGRRRGFATGGLVPGSGNRDTVPAMLTPGEFVIRKKAVESIGISNLASMNKYANGGSVADSSASPQLYRRGSLTYSIDDMKAAAKRKGMTLEQLKALLEERQNNEWKDYVIPYYEVEKRFGLTSYRPPDSALYQKTMAAKIAKEDRIDAWKQSQGIATRDYEGKSAREKGFLAARQRRGFASGGVVNAPLVDDILSNAKGSMLPSRLALERLIQTGYGALDFDRTLKRTTGDAAYAKAKTPQQKDAVLSRYFRNPSNRLSDAKNAKLTQFGKSLQEAIQSKQVNPRNLSIISKSSRVPGLAEHINELFGIPIANMIFTSGKSKEPALEAMRTKGPRLNRVFKNLGGFVQNFTTGKEVKSLSQAEQEELTGLINLEERARASGNKLRAFTLDKQKRLAQLRSRKELAGEQSSEIINGIKLSKNFGVSFLEGGATEISANINDVLTRGNATGTDKLRQFIGNKQRARGAKIITDGVGSTLSPGGKEIFDREIINGLPNLFDNAVSQLPEPLKPARGEVSIDQLISSSAKQAIKGYFFEAFIRRASQNLLSDNDKTDPIFDFSGAGNKGALNRLFGSRFITPNEFKVSPTPENIANAISKAIAVSPSSALQYFNAGGSVQDTVPAMLTPGEFVINKKAASKIGSSRLHQLNRADRVGYNKGGPVGRVQNFAIGGAVAAGGQAVANALSRVLPSIVNSFKQLQTAVEPLAPRLRTLGRNVPSGGGWMGPDPGRQITTGGMTITEADSSGQSLTSLGLMEKPSLSKRARGIGRRLNKLGGTGGLIALTAGGAIADSIGGAIGGPAGQYTSSMSSEALNYGTIGASIGSMFGPLGTAAGAAGGALLGLVVGASKAKQALQEIEKQRISEKREASGEVSKQAIDRYAKSGTQMDKGLALIAYSKTIKAEKDSMKLATGGFKKEFNQMSTKDIASIQSAGTDQAVAFLSAEMLNTGKTLEEVKKSMDPQLFSAFSTEIAESQYEYIEAQKKINEELIAAKGNEQKQNEIKAKGKKTLEEIRDKNVKLALSVTEAEVQARIAAKTQAEVRKQVESIVDKYRKISAQLQAFGDSIESIEQNALDQAKVFRGEAEINKVDRSNEKVLGNLSGYSMADVSAVASRVVSLSGDQELGTNIQSAKLAQDILPDILRNTEAKNIDEVIKELQKGFGDIPLPKFLEKDIRATLGDENVSRQGKTFKEIADDPSLLNNLSKALGASLETATQYLKQYNDAFQRVINLSNEYAKAIQESTDWQLKADDIRTRSAIQLSQALGKEISLDDLNKPFEDRIRRLTGDIAFGGSTDPAEIARGMNDAILARPATEKRLETLKQEQLSVNPQDEKGKAQAAKAVLEQTKLLGAQNNAINNSRKALEELANDSTAASNALSKIQEVQRVSEGATNFARQALTSDGEQLSKMNSALSAYIKTTSGQATAKDFNQLEFRQQSFEGLDLIKNLMPESMGKRIEAQMTKQMLESTPQGRALLEKQMAIGPEGEKISLAGALDNAASGIDPVQQKYIDAYSAATAKQAAAADELAKAATSVSQIFEGKMLEILNKIGETMGVKNGAAPVVPGAAAAGIPAPQGVVAGAAIPGAVAANNVAGAANNNGGGGANFAGFGPITVDEAAKEFAQTINVSFNNFGKYVEQLAGIRIPEKIELTGNYVLDVRVTGAAAFEALDQRMKDLAVALVEPKIESLRNEVSKLVGGEVKPSVTLGKKR